MAARSIEVSIGVIGTGGVGACFLEQLKYVSDHLSKPKLRLCYVAMIDKALYHDDYAAIDIGTAQARLEFHGKAPPSISQTIQYLSGAPGRVVMVDNTSAASLAEAYPLFLARGISIVTPNKKAFSGSYELWQSIFEAAGIAGSVVYHESSVGAGMPIISTLKDFVASGDEVRRIEGVFSGTMSYLFNNFCPIEGKGGKWSEEVKKAKQSGFTEPDPRDDLNGLDVARKLTILGRLAGLPISSPTSFPVESLIPEALANTASIEEFLEKLHEFDDEMERRKEDASAAGKVLRFVGSVDMVTKQAKVGLEWFDPDHPIALLKGSDNIISFHTKRYEKQPLTIQGAGAGGQVTAMGVTSDLLRVLSQIGK